MVGVEGKERQNGGEKGEVEKGGGKEGSGKREVQVGEPFWEGGLGKKKNRRRRRRRCTMNGRKSGKGRNIGKVKQTLM